MGKIIYRLQEEEEERNLKIPIHEIPERDYLIWPRRRNGMFSVKSAYQVALKLKSLKEDTGKASCSRQVVSRVWKMI